MLHHSHLGIVKDSRWIPGTIMSQTNSVSIIKTLDGHIMRKHRNHLKHRYTNETVNSVILYSMDVTQHITAGNSQPIVLNPV